MVERADRHPDGPSLQNGRILAHLFGGGKHLFGPALDANRCSCYGASEHMFVQDRVVLAYARPRRRRGLGRVILLALALLLASAKLAYGSGPAHYDTVVVAPGDSVWTIASAHYGGDPRAHVDAILAANHLGGPSLIPGQSLLLPQQ